MDHSGLDPSLNQGLDTTPWTTEKTIAQDAHNFLIWQHEKKRNAILVVWPTALATVCKEKNGRI
jgi:hypothetical protein